MNNILRQRNNLHPAFLGRELSMHPRVTRFLQEVVHDVALGQFDIHGCSYRAPFPPRFYRQALTRMGRCAQLQLNFGVLGSSYELRDAELSSLVLPGHDNVEIIWEFFEQFPEVKTKIADLCKEDHVTIIFYGGLDYMDIWVQKNVELDRNINGVVPRKFTHSFAQD